MTDYQLNRRKLIRLLFACGLGTSLPAHAIAAITDPALDWQSFVEQMESLADDHGSGRITIDQVASSGLAILQKLDTDDAGYLQAVDQSFESGNNFWLWQRLLKQTRLNGGILHIESARSVQLHDHPGATGVLRILDGEVEIMQYDVVKKHNAAGQALLNKVAHRTLRPGDTAVLKPESGNIHALRSLSDECSMLDFFIPPFNKSRRTWFEPTEKNWYSHDSIVCRPIAEHDYLLSCVQPRATDYS